ncbi:MAG: RNA polymerase sigma factor [Planctomycetota bacterium]
MEDISFKMLVDRHSTPVLNTAIRIVGNCQCAQDIHQEVFLAILRRWHKFNGKTNWPAYLYRTTVRKAMELVKRKRREVPLADQGQWAVAKEDPLGPLRDHELRQQLLKHLSNLPSRQADAFVLSRIEGLKNRQIAEIMGCSRDTVNTHLHRALKRLRNELADLL